MFVFFILNKMLYDPCMDVKWNNFRSLSSPAAGLWLAYIRHEITHPEGSQGKAMQLHWKAMKTLEGEQVEQFVNGYTLMQTKDSGDWTFRFQEGNKVKARL